MGLLTVNAILAEVLSNLGNVDSSRLGISSIDTTGGTNRVYLFIDQTQTELTSLRLQDGRFHHHRPLEETTQQTLVTDQRAYSTIPATAVQTPTVGIQAVRVFNPSQTTRGWRLDPIRDREEFERRIIKSALPRYYAVFGDVNELLLAPPPLSTYNNFTLEVRRYRRPKLITAGNLKSGGPMDTLAVTDPLEFGEEWDEAIILGATARAFRALNLTQLADGMKGEFMALTADTARRHQVEGEDLDFGPPIEMPYFQMPF